MKLKLMMSALCIFVSLHAALEETLMRSVQVAKALRTVKPILLPGNDQEPVVVDNKGPLLPSDKDQQAIAGVPDDSPQAKAARAAIERAKREKERNAQVNNQTVAKEVESDDDMSDDAQQNLSEPLFAQREDQGSGNVTVVQLAVPLQSESKKLPKSIQEFESGNCGYHAVLNVIALDAMLTELEAEQRCVFQGDANLRSHDRYKDAVQIFINTVVNSRKSREQNQLIYELRQAQDQAKQTAVVVQAKKSKKSKKAKKAKQVTPQAQARQRVDNWLNKPWWISGNEVEQLLETVNISAPVLVVEYIPGLDLTEQQKNRFAELRNAEPGAMLGLIWNDGHRDYSGAESGLHWVGMVAVKCADGSITLYVMDSAGMHTNAAHAVQAILGQEHRQVEDMYEDMQQQIEQLGHPDRTVPATARELVDVVLTRWPKHWIPANIQLQFLLLLQQAVPRALVQDLQYLIENQNQLRVNLTGHAKGVHDANKEAFNHLVAQVQELLPDVEISDEGEES